MQYELKSLGIWAFTKVSFFFNLIIGFLFGLMYALLFSFLVAVMSQFPGLDAAELNLEGMSLGIMVIVMPLVFSIGWAVFNTLIGLANQHGILPVIYKTLKKLSQRGSALSTNHDTLLADLKQ